MPNTYATESGDFLPFESRVIIPGRVRRRKRVKSKVVLPSRFTSETVQKGSFKILIGEVEEIRIGDGVGKG